MSLLVYKKRSCLLVFLLSLVRKGSRFLFTLLSATEPSTLPGRAWQSNGPRQVRRGGRAGWGGEVSSILSLSFLSKNGVRFNVLSSTLDNFPFTRREMDIPTKKKQPLGPILHTETCFVFISQYGDTVSFVTLVPT